MGVTSDAVQLVAAADELPTAVDSLQAVFTFGFLTFFITLQASERLDAHKVP
jgi:hypothetical protein